MLILWLTLKSLMLMKVIQYDNVNDDDDDDDDDDDVAKLDDNDDAKL